MIKKKIVSQVESNHRRLHEYKTILPKLIKQQWVTSG